ncbi:hypothetical protein GIR35_12580 [Enterococcus faecalis]|nr:hypothetical protein GIR35_12580 [Enterococcus faecalis]
MKQQAEVKKRFKTYKAKKHWVVAPILFLGVLGVVGLATDNVQAAELDTQPGLLVKNVCCLELNQDALHIWFVYSLFSFQRSTLPRSNFYIITNFRLNVKNFF